ncbi:hypothetical protein TcG_06567 [Trypanosoma cruzi]|uniref:Uncharacterized protein n=2 Tax=Trypanosoma cruzi TaxID=5693 RepID=V5AVG0_TRYCR|nr:hypothetical protein TCDM_06998 [Trypanosoma cruzi Dm28c]KAF8292882.1 hypothetical protein TcBrA4_0073140 [Trypanosoma cruzi]PBJ73665.1 hypothetical protein BCY84_13722 [Trypanosoma cruzi cruzi]PWU90368.1 hypothetical protein C4B63_51g106 [Trypanosoma cruzi]RNF16409.1 hypothetical protein TcG_06567 [Trypanosoma cruzi]
MQQNEFNSVEAELREIEEDFASGQMNAFGTAATKENFVRELRRIADIETQVFYKTCGLLSASTSEDHLMRTMMLASADAPCAGGGGGGASSSNNSDEGNTTVATTRSFGRENNSSNSYATKSMKKDVANPPKMSGGFSPGSPSESRGPGTENSASPGFSDAGPPPWSNDAGFTDRPFQDVARHFKLLEGEFTAIGEHLRQISKHVLQLNEIAERVRSKGSNLGP